MQENEETGTFCFSPPPRLLLLRNKISDDDDGSYVEEFSRMPFEHPAP